MSHLQEVDFLYASVEFFHLQDHLIMHDQQISNG